MSRSTLTVKELGVQAMLLGQGERCFYDPADHTFNIYDGNGERKELCADTLEEFDASEFNTYHARCKLVKEGKLGAADHNPNGEYDV